MKKWITPMNTYIILNVMMATYFVCDAIFAMNSIYKKIMQVVVIETLILHLIYVLRRYR